MRLLETLPRLPEGEGNLWTHNTGGEHATKFSGDEARYNVLREANLSPPPAPLGREEFFEMLISDSHEVVVVDRQNLPEGNSGATGLVAAGVGVRTRQGKFDKTMRVTELLVHPDLRQKGLASFILGKLIRSEHYGSGELTELVFEASFFETDEWLEEKLEETGFRHIKHDYSPALWLPGNTSHFGNDVNLDDLGEIDKILAHMPEGWHGYFNFYPETDPQTQVFRNGQIIGLVQADEDSFRQDEAEMFVRDVRLTDAGGAKLDELKGVTEREAITALLNNYELIPN
ncbi:MAG: hypothetical protein WEC84_03735 [Candidatus Andersenbacteria bacterium]